MQLYFATKNKGKVDSIQKRLEEFKIDVIQAPLDIHEPSDDMPCTLDSINTLLTQSHVPEQLEDIALSKVQSAYTQLKESCIALDAGFFLPALRGFPGAYVNVTLKCKEYGIEGILSCMKGKSRHAEFVNCLAYADGAGKRKLFVSSVVGTLSEEGKGPTRSYQWSELFKIFIPQGETKTLAEMDPGNYYAWMTERKASSQTTKFGQWLVKTSGPFTQR